jgi:hypothetical protein
MGKYSVFSNLLADKLFEDYLNKLTSIILFNIHPKSIKSILLIGGYGRGEGGIYLEEGNYYFTNDIDLLVITNKYFKKTDSKIKIIEKQFDSIKSELNGIKK